MAGLSAARELLRRGWPKDKVVLLEASGRIGGRVSGHERGGVGSVYAVAAREELESGDRDDGQRP